MVPMPELPEVETVRQGLRTWVAGRTIERVESHGKHLEIEWDDGVILHTHMRMSG